MLDTPQITQSPAQLTAFIHLTIPRSEMQNAMGPGIREVFDTVSAQGLKPTGSWFTHHLKMEPEIWDFEICVPVDRPVVAAGRVKPGQLRAARVARIVYQGPYEGLGEAWGELMDWIETNGHKSAPDLWERYVVGPESGADPGKWRTELNRPLLD